MRFRLRTLLILLAVLSPALAAGWWKYLAWTAERDRVALQRGDGRGWATIHGPTPTGATEVPIDQNSYWHHETITPRKP